MSQMQFFVQSWREQTCLMGVYIDHIDQMRIDLGENVIFTNIMLNFSITCRRNTNWKEQPGSLGFSCQSGTIKFYHLVQSTIFGSKFSIQ